MSTVRYCPHCGSEVFYDGDFCVNCGGTLEGPDPRASDTPTQAIPQRSAPIPSAFAPGQPTRQMSRREFIQNAQMESVNGSADLAALAASTSSLLAHGDARRKPASTDDALQPPTVQQDAQAAGDTARNDDDAADSASSDIRATGPVPAHDGTEQHDGTAGEHPDVNFALDWASDTWGIAALPKNIWSLDSSSQPASDQPAAADDKPWPGETANQTTETGQAGHQLEPAEPASVDEPVEAAPDRQSAPAHTTATDQLPALEPEEQPQSAVENTDIDDHSDAAENTGETPGIADTGRMSVTQTAAEPSRAGTDASIRQTEPDDDTDVPTQVIERADTPADTGPLPYNIPSADMTGHTAAVYTPATTASGMPAIGTPDDTDMATAAMPQAVTPDETGTQVMPQAHAGRPTTDTAHAPASSTTPTPAASPNRWRPIVIVCVAAVLCVCVGLGITAARRHASPAATTQTATSAPSGATTSASPSASAPSAASASPSSAGVYTNSTMGYQVSIPDGYVWHDETDNGSSRSFTNDAIGMTIAVSGKANTTGATVSSEYAACASGHAVSYHLLSGDIMVCSYSDNNTITYIKEIVTRRTILTLRFDYPQSAKTDGSAVIDQVFPSFVSTQ